MTNLFLDVFCVTVSSLSAGISLTLGILHQGILA